MTSPALRRHRRTLGRAGVVLLYAALLAGGGAVAVRMITPLQELPRVPLVASFIVYGTIAWLAALIIGVGMRRRAAAAVALAGLVLQLIWVVPYYVADDPPTGVPLSVASVNIHGGAVDPELLVDRFDTDIVVLVELDSDTARYLEVLDWQERYPYRAGADDPQGVAGTMIFSRYPLEPLEPIPTRWGGYAARLTVPGAAPVVVQGVHPVNPLFGTPAWLEEGSSVAEAARTYRGQPQIVLGDLNAVPDHVTVRDIKRAGELESATDLAGAGWLPTWPDNHSRLPRVLPLDQVLVGGGVGATSVRIVHAPRSDHAGIRAELILPRVR